MLQQRLVQHMLTLAVHNSIRHKDNKNKKKLFLDFYQIVGVQQQI